MSTERLLPHMYAQNFHRRARAARGAKLLGLAAGAGALYNAFSDKEPDLPYPPGAQPYQEPSLMRNLWESGSSLFGDKDVSPQGVKESSMRRIDARRIRLASRLF